MSGDSVNLLPSEEMYNGSYGPDDDVTLLMRERGEGECG